MFLKSGPLFNASKLQPPLYYIQVFFPFKTSQFLYFSSASNLQKILLFHLQAFQRNDKLLHHINLNLNPPMANKLDLLEFGFNHLSVSGYPFCPGWILMDEIAARS